MPNTPATPQSQFPQLQVFHPYPVPASIDTRTSTTSKSDLKAFPFHPEQWNPHSPTSVLRFLDYCHQLEWTLIYRPDDLKNRRFEIEAFLWLLHQHGFEVIGRGGDDAGWPWWRMARQILPFLTVAHDNGRLINQLMRQKPQLPQAAPILNSKGEARFRGPLTPDRYGEEQVARMGGHQIATSIYSKRMRDATRDLREGGEEFCGKDWRKRNEVIRATVGSLMREYWAGGKGGQMGKKGVGLSGEQRITAYHLLTTRRSFNQSGTDSSATGLFIEWGPEVVEIPDDEPRSRENQNDSSRTGLEELIKENERLEFDDELDLLSWVFVVDEDREKVVGDNVVKLEGGDAEG
ncbi:MAG: hypothetical protein Q9174_003938, partial [Haloplaca sp. 1 TL-2023]